MMQFFGRFPAQTFVLAALFPLILALLVFSPNAARADTYVNNEVVLRVEVERAGRKWSLSAIPSLEKDDAVYVQLANARGFRDKFPFVANQRVASMKPDHGFIVIAAFIDRTATAGLDGSSFPRPVLSPDKSSLVFKTPRPEATPFFFLVPAIYDTAYDRVKEREQFVKSVIESGDLRAYLLRQVTAPTASGLSRALPTEETDALLQKTQFLMPRISAAIKLRDDPKFRTRSKDQQTEDLYKALGLDLPSDPGALDYANNLLDAFATTDPTKPVKVPSEQQLGNLITMGVAILPGWYGTYLAGMNVFGKLSVILSGINRRVRDERYFVAAQFIPRKDEKGAELSGLYTLEPQENLLPNNPQKPGQKRKNVLVVCFGRTGLTRSIIRPTPGAPAATVYLDNEVPRRLLTVDPKSPLSPEQLDRYTSNLQLVVADGSAPIPLVYERSANAFRLETDRDLLLKPVNAVLRGDWGHTGNLVDVSDKFLLSGVKRAKWAIENPTALTPGGKEPIRLRPETPIRPIKVVFRYKSGGEFEAQAIEDKQGYYAVRFDLTDKRIGEGRLEIIKPGTDVADHIETFKDETGADVPLQIFDAVRPVGADDVRYYAYDSQLRLRRALFTENTLPVRLTVDGTVFERPADTPNEEWLLFETKQPRTKDGMTNGTLLLRDKRTLPVSVRVRSRRPAAALSDWQPRERVVIPWELPKNTVSQHAALLLTFTAAEGYRFQRNARLVLGGASLSPDREITDSAGAETVTFTLEPRMYPNLRGRLTARLREERDGGEVAQGDEFPLPFTIAQLPDGPVTLRVQNGKYRLSGQRLDVFAGAGTGDTLDAVQATVTPQGSYIEFSGVPGQPIDFRLRQPDTRLRWTGPILPAAPASLTAERAENKSVLRWGRSAGATGYIVYRSTDPAVPLTPQNRLAEVPESDAPTFEDTAPLNPGDVYRYRVVAVSNRDGGPVEDFVMPSGVSAPVLVPPATPLNIGAEYKAGEKPLVEVRFSKASGATLYRIYRGNAPDFVPTPENKVAEIVASEMPVWQDTVPLTPGAKYYYRVVAVTVREGIPKEGVSPLSNASNPVGL